MGEVNFPSSRVCRSHSSQSRVFAGLSCSSSVYGISRGVLVLDSGGGSVIRALAHSKPSEVCARKIMSSCRAGACNGICFISQMSCKRFDRFAYDVILSVGRGVERGHPYITWARTHCAQWGFTLV